MKVLQNIASNRLSDVFLYPSDTIYSGLLSANIEQEVTVPTGADFCIFNYDADIYVNYDTTASVPSGSISSGGGELNPIKRYVGETTTLHIISPSSTHVTLSFFKKTDV